MRIIIDYGIAEECCNIETIYNCYKCGECGRKFNDDGYMVDECGTHFLEVEE